jgi:hypothetical protein
MFNGICYGICYMFNGMWPHFSKRGHWVERFTWININYIPPILDTFWLENHTVQILMHRSPTWEGCIEGHCQDPNWNDKWIIDILDRNEKKTTFLQKRPLSFVKQPQTQQHNNCMLEGCPPSPPLWFRMGARAHLLHFLAPSISRICHQSPTVSWVTRQLYLWYHIFAFLKWPPFLRFLGDFGFSPDPGQ